MKTKNIKLFAIFTAILLAAMPIFSHADELRIERRFPEVSATECAERLPVGQAFTLTAKAENLVGNETISYQWQYSMKNLSEYGIWKDVNQDTSWATAADGTLTVSSDFSNSYSVIEMQEGSEATVFRCLVTVDQKTQRTKEVCPQFYAATAIKEVKLVGFTEPENGGAPQRTITVSKGKNETIHYDVDSVIWLRRSEGVWKELKNGETFTDGVYRLDVKLSAENPYVFSFDEITSEKYTIDGMQAIRTSGETMSECTLTLTRWVGVAPAGENPDGEVPAALNPKKDATQTTSTDSPLSYQVVYDSVPNTFAGLRGTLLKGTVVEGVSIANGFLTYRFGSSTGEIYLAYVSKTEENPDPEVTMISEYGATITETTPIFRTVTKDTLIKIFQGEEPLAVGILKEGTSFIAEGEEMKGGAEWISMTYHGVNCLVAKGDTKEAENISELCPTIKTDLTDITVLEGETATFTFEVDVPRYLDQVADIKDGQIPRIAERTWTPAFYYFVSNLDFTEIENQGFGDVEWSPETSTLTIKNCSEKLNGLTIQGAVRSYDTVYTTTATLTVRKEAELPQTDCISTVSVGVLETTGATVLTENAQVIDEGLNQDGFREILLAPPAGKAFTNDVEVTLVSEMMALKEKELRADGMIRLLLEVVPKTEVEASDESKLALSAKTIVVKEGTTLSEALELLNTTEKTPEFSLAEGETLPEGLSLNQTGKIVGTVSKGTSGIYFVTVSAKTEPVLITEKRTEMVTEYVRTAFPSEELKGNQTITGTIAASDLSSIQASGKTQYTTEGLYTYGVSYQGNKWQVTFTSARADYPVGAGTCSVTMNGNGSLTYSHKGSVLISSVRYETTPVQVEKVITEEVISEPTTSATVTMIITPNHVHLFSIPEKSYFCELDGEVVLQCECGETRTFETRARGHQFGALTYVSGSCFDENDDSEGGTILQHICEACGLHGQISVSETGHADRNHDGVCDYCVASLRVEKLSEVTGISVEDIENGKITPEHHAEKDEKENKDFSWLLPAGVMGGFMLLAIAVIVVIIVASKKSKNEQKEQETKDNSEK